MAAPSKLEADALTPIERLPLYKEIFARLQTLVASAELRPGDRLPAERELATRLGVSRNSLRPALAALEALGVLEIRHGAGAFLRRTTLTEVAGSFASTLLERNSHLPAAMEARLAIERFAVALAAARRDDADLGRIERALDRMAAEIDDGGDGSHGDRAFHHALAESAHNPVLVDLLLSIEAPIARIREESLAQPGQPERSLAAHRRILDAVRGGDPQRAVAAVDAHLADVAGTLLVRGEQ